MSCPLRLICINACRAQRSYPNKGKIHKATTSHGYFQYLKSLGPFALQEQLWFGLDVSLNYSLTTLNTSDYHIILLNSYRINSNK